MEILQTILMGIVQGLSEFLPISSSAHLVFSSNAYKIVKNIPITQTNQEIFLDIMLHLGTLIAILIFFKKDILQIFKAIYFGIKQKNYQTADFKVGMYILLGTILTVVVACPLYSLAEKLVFAPSLVAMLLIFTGLLLLFSEFYSKKHCRKSQVDIKISIMIGIAQGLASLPGFSRSGLTISTGLLAGMDRQTAARYSFLLSIPIIIGASLVYPILTVDLAEVVTYNWLAIIIGTIVSGVVGYFCIKYFLKFLNKFSLALFGYYCIMVGVIAFLFFK